MIKQLLKNINKIAVEQLENKNQFVITYENEQQQTLICFQSYKTLIAIYNQTTKELYINYPYWDYSKTTMKHLKIFINTYTIYGYDNKKQFADFIASTKNDKIKLFE